MCTKALEFMVGIYNIYGVFFIYCNSYYGLLWVIFLNLVMWNSGDVVVG